MANNKEQQVEIRVPAEDDGWNKLGFSAAVFLATLKGTAGEIWKNALFDKNKTGSLNQNTNGQLDAPGFLPGPIKSWVSGHRDDTFFETAKVPGSLRSAYEDAQTSYAAAEKQHGRWMRQKETLGSLRDAYDTLDTDKITVARIQELGRSTIRDIGEESSPEIRRFFRNIENQAETAKPEAVDRAIRNAFEQQIDTLETRLGNDNPEDALKSAGKSLEHAKEGIRDKVAARHMDIAFKVGITTILTAINGLRARNDLNFMGEKLSSSIAYASEGKITSERDITMLSVLRSPLEVVNTERKDIQKRLMHNTVRDVASSALFGPLGGIAASLSTDLGYNKNNAFGAILELEKSLGNAEAVSTKEVKNIFVQHHKDMRKGLSAKKSKQLDEVSEYIAGKLNDPDTPHSVGMMAAVVDFNPKIGMFSPSGHLKSDWKEVVDAVGRCCDPELAVEEQAVAEGAMDAKGEDEREEAWRKHLEREPEPITPKGFQPDANSGKAFNFAEGVDKSRENNAGVGLSA